MAPVLQTPARPPMPGSLKQLSESLKSAAEQLMVLKDFNSALQTCSSGLGRLSVMEEEDARSSELKAGFCIVGIQALAEMNQWPRVLSWLLQYYENPESLPARVLQMCIILYSKVGEASVVQEAARVWFHCESNKRVAGFRTVAELYLLQVLVPLGLVDQARQLVQGELWGTVFSEEQRRTALEVVQEKANESADPCPSPDPGHHGSVIQCLQAVLRLAYRKLLLSDSGSLQLHQLLLATLLLYLLFLRLDPALPSSFLWISKLLHVLRHTWNHVISLSAPKPNKRL